MLAKTDSQAGNSIVVVKARTLGIKRFYEINNHILHKIEENATFNNKLSKATNARPVIVYEATTYKDIQALMDKIKNLIDVKDKDAIMILSGGGAYKRLHQKGAS